MCHLDRAKICVRQAVPIAKLMVKYAIYLNSMEKLNAMEKVEHYIKRAQTKNRLKLRTAGLREQIFS